MTTRRRDLALVCGLIAVAVFLQAPGRIAADTKIDLALSPVDFLARALHAWEPRAAFGHVQNQAAGYLFPMGPFFALGFVVGAPAWVVQRLWLAALLGLACWGTVRVGDALGIGKPGARIVAGLAYALSPAMLTPLGIASGGQVPAALLPWVMLPLIKASQGRPPRTAAAQSALAVMAMGAVNASSTLCVLPLPALFLLSRRRGSARRTLIAWWAGAVALACSWWAIPLALQARYGANFVPFTESSSVTTATTSTFETLRGTGYWLAYLFQHGPWLPGGWAVVSQPLVIAATVAVVAVGLVGLTRRDMPERRFFIIALLAGMAVVGAGYGGGALTGPQSAVVRHLLSGSLSALRNVTKFEPVLRLPLALGVAHAAGMVRRLAVPAMTLVVVAAAAPLTEGTLLPSGAFTAVPGYWSDAAHWLAANAHGQRALVVPAAAFGEYVWGRPLDEPIQALSRSPWVVRDLIPLGNDGSSRLLDAIERNLEQGQVPPGLVETLHRAGIGYIVVRNDLDMARAGQAAPVYLEDTLTTIPAVQLAFGFGPAVSPAVGPDRLRSPTHAAPLHAVDIYRVDGAATPVQSYPAAGIVQLSGGPEAMLTAGALPDVVDHATVAAGDPLPPNLTSSLDVVTDGLQLRDTDFGIVRDNVSYVLTPSVGKQPRQRTPIHGVAHETVAVVQGAATVQASASGPAPVRLPEDGPFSAFDGSPSTAWVAGGTRSTGAWIEVDFDHPIDVPSMTVQLLHDSPVRTLANAVVVSTTTGALPTRLLPVEAPQPVAVPPGRTSRLRLTITDTPAPFAGIREIAVPGVRVTRPWRVPVDNSISGPFVFQRAAADPFDATRWDEEASLDRLFTVPSATRYDVSGVVNSVAAPVASTSRGLSVKASSTWHALPTFAPLQLVDGDPASSWVADPLDGHPTIGLAWPGARVLDQVQIVAAPAPTARPTRLDIVAGSEHRSVVLGADGVGRFAPLSTDHVDVTVTASALADPTHTIGGVLTPNAVGMAELRFPSLDDLRGPSASAMASVPCGQGPVVTVDGVGHAVSVTETGSFTVCDGPILLRPGPHRLQAHVDRVLLDPGSAAQGPSRPASVRTWNADHRTVAVGAGPASVLAVSENFNAGWHASLGGVGLRPVRLDGWRQGWVVPPGPAGLVRMTFAPQRWYRAALWEGLVAAVALVVAALWRADPRASIGAQPSTWIEAGVAAFLIGGLLGGPIAGVAPIALLLPARWWRPGLMAGGAVLVAGSLAVRRHGAYPASHAGAFSPVVQALCVLALVVVACDLGPDRRGGS